jgi:hypothetical protein
MKLNHSQSGTPWVWYRRCGMPFNRRKPLHWVIALVELWRKGHRPK